MKKRSVGKKTRCKQLNPKLKKAWDYGVTVFCIANNGAYFLGQKELVKGLTRDVYQFSKDKAKRIKVLPKHKLKIKYMKNIPKHISNLMNKLR